MKSQKNTNYILLHNLNAVAAVEQERAAADTKTLKYKFCTAGYKDVQKYIEDHSPVVLFLGLETVRLTEPRQTFSDSTEEDDSDDSVVAWFAVDATSLSKEEIRQFYPDADIIDAYSGALNLTPNHATLYAQARSLMAWHDRNRFCPTCGSETTLADGGYKRTCTEQDCRSRKGFTLILSQLECS